MENATQTSEDKRLYVLFSARKQRFGEWANESGASRGPLIFPDFASAQTFVRRLGKATRGYAPLAKPMSDITASASRFGWTHIWTREGDSLTERSIFRGVPINLSDVMGTHGN